jgi:tRNA A-37 threonylcarbamoyl transferase component Bud32/Leucine-rich repeat (LRR) protein
VSTLSDYDLIEVIGEGASGVVYRARHRALDRLVAIKLLPARSVDANDLARLRQEARLAASLEHPHIVPVYEVGQDDGGRFFLVMKLIEGTDLKKSADSLRREPRKLARVMASVARAVQHAHERGVLHRDLKPANILLDADAQPHLIDFGLARPLEGGAYLTATGVIVGTPAYLSPEQAAGCKQIGPGTDIWALGVILHELLTGKPPFEGGTPYAVLLAIQSSPVALSRRASTDLERICLRCLQKAPADRYSSAADLAEHLERVSRGERLRHTWRDRGATLLRRWGPRTALAAGILVVIALVLLPALSQREIEQERKHQQEAVARAAVCLNEEDPEAVAKITDADLERLRENGLLHLWIMASERLRRKRGLPGRERGPLDGWPSRTQENPLTNDDEITHLDLRGTRITDAGMKHLAGLKNLGWLVLAELPITEAGLKHLAGLTNLGRLDLGNLPITEAGLKHLAGLKNLRELQFSSLQVTDAVLACLVQDDLLAACKAGIFSQTLLTDDGRRQGIRGGPGVTRNNQIVALDLRQSKVTNAGLQHLKELENLRRLALRSDQLTVAGLKHLAGLKKLNLLLYDGAVTDELLAVLHQNGQIHVLPSATGRPAHTTSDQMDARAENDAGIVSLGLGEITDTGLKYLAGLKNLQHLHVGGTGITGEGLKHLGGLQDLQTLGLSGMKVTPAGLKHLAGLKKLQRLGIANDQVTDEVLEVLHQSRQLHILQLPTGDGNSQPPSDEAIAAIVIANEGRNGSDRYGITNKGLQYLAGLKGLKRLCLSDLPITDEGLQHLAGLTSLQELCLRKLKITEAGLKHLSGLKQLNLLGHDGAVTDELLAVLHQSRQIHILGSAVGDGNKRPLSDDAIVSFAAGRQSPGHRITNKGLKYLAGLKNLQHLNVSDSGITDEGLKHLGGLQDLQTLDLYGVKATPAGLKHLAGLKKLRRLNIHKDQVTDEVLEALHQSRQLHILDLSFGGNSRYQSDDAIADIVLDGSRRYRITNKGLKYLAGLKNLQRLSLADLPITDEGLQHLAGLTSLRTLNLGHTRVTGDGLKHLAGLTNLEWLDLSDLPITDAGLMHLPRSKKLGGIVLYRTKVTLEGVRAARAALKLPEACKFVRD